MNAFHQTEWSLLGSSLWLRPVRPSDLKRLESFLARRDLLRSRGAGSKELSRLLPWDTDPKDHGRSGLARIATDGLGAPAGFYAVHSGLGDGPPELSLAVPKDAPGLLREGLRLLADGLRAHSDLDSLLLRAEHEDLEETLRGSGWKPGDPGTWVRRLRESSYEAHRAG